MADGHLGYIMPIGGVAAYHKMVSVAGNDFNIACGNAAIRTDLTLERLELGLPELADEIHEAISFGIGRKNLDDDAPVNDPLFADDAWEVMPRAGGVRDKLLARARSQLDTVGSGNHYVDVFADEEGRLWVSVHFGSRGFGHEVASSVTVEQVERILAAQGYAVPEEDLVEITAQLNAQLEGSAALDRTAAAEAEPWHALFPFGATRDR